MTSECNAALAAGDFVRAARLTNDFTCAVANANDAASEIKRAYGYTLLARAAYEMAGTVTPHERKDLLVGFFVSYAGGFRAFQSLTGEDRRSSDPTFKTLNTLSEAAYERFDATEAAAADLRANAILSDAKGDPALLADLLASDAPYRTPGPLKCTRACSRRRRKPLDSQTFRCVKRRERISETRGRWASTSARAFGPAPSD